MEQRGISKSEFARRMRSRLIRQFYFQWMGNHEDRSVFNKSLGDDIHIKYISVNETANQQILRPRIKKGLNVC